jgi:hypothetical protein
MNFMLTPVKWLAEVVRCGHLLPPVVMVRVSRLPVKLGSARLVEAGWRANGAELVGEVTQYEDNYRLCYMQGPAGIIVALAEELF